jgi:hypothetical protein
MANTGGAAGLPQEILTTTAPPLRAGCCRQERRSIPTMEELLPGERQTLWLHGHDHAS